MPFITRNDDVFALSGSEIVYGSNLAVTEQRVLDDCPVQFDMDLRSARGASAAVDVAWRRISAKRQQQGDLVDFTVTLKRDDKAEAGDLFILRFPFSPAILSDPDFAIMGAASFKVEAEGRLNGVELGLAFCARPAPPHGGF